MQQIAFQEKLLQVEKAILVISSLIPSDLTLLLHPFYTTKFLQEASVDFFEDRIIAILIPGFKFFFLI